MLEESEDSCRRSPSCLLGTFRDSNRRRPPEPRFSARISEIDKLLAILGDNAVGVAELCVHQSPNIVNRGISEPPTR
jgi:hypothetical protein